MSAYYGDQKDFMAEVNRRVDQFLNRPQGVLMILALIIAGIGLFSAFYTVDTFEEGVVLRFGKYVRTSPPGLHFKLPFGIDKAIKVKTKVRLQEEFGFRSRQASAYGSAYKKSFKRRAEQESLMLTGDLNVADVEWITQFQISDPKKFLFHTNDPIKNVRDISEAIMRRVVGDRLVNDVLTTGKREISEEAQRLMQDVVDRYDMGVQIIMVKLQDVNPPEEVKPSFNDVNAAKQQQEELINQAEKHYNKIIPEARGKAEETIAAAQGYAAAKINQAEGDANRFEMLLKEYNRAPSVTSRRLYLQTMEKLLKRFESVTVVDDDVKGVLPVFKAGVLDGAKNSQ
jgi:membrane protease subunit HflK